MNRSVAAASATAIAASTTPVVSTAPEDREWWGAEAARTGTDWEGVIATAFEMMVAGGILEPERMTTWDAPSWREAVVEYHRDRAGRLAVEIEPKRLARLRRLMADSVSIEHVYYEINRSNATPAVTLDAIKLSVRDRGIKALHEPLNQERIRRCDPAARASLDRWLADFRTEK
jgi:hypothetical protein